MEIRRTTINTLSNVYYNSSYFRSDNYMSLSYFSNNIFNLFIYVKRRNNHVSVPLFCVHYVQDNIHKTDIEEYIGTLCITEYPQVKRTAMSIVKVFNDTNFSSRLVKVTTNKGEVYYGGYGVIFDKDMNPLLLCTMEGDYENDEFTYNKAVVYVNPCVFNNKGILEKAIVSTLIPVYTKNNITFFDSFHRTTHFRPEVVVKDFTNDFFVKPSKPKIKDFTKDNVNEFLLANIDDICL